jgi:diguanylate cyclase (GGDEF)-like protein/PAS domain S-box-containing protein
MHVGLANGPIGVDARSRLNASGHFLMGARLRIGSEKSNTAPVRSSGTDSDSSQPKPALPRISDRKKAAATDPTKASDQLAIVASIIERSPTVIGCWLLPASDADQRGPVLEYISANAAQFGYSAEDLLAGQIAFVADLVHADDQAQLLASMQPAAERDAAVPQIEFRILCKGGECRWVEAHLTTERDAGDSLIRCYGLIRDITARKQAEENLEFARTLVRLEMESSPDAILVVNANRPANRAIEAFNKRFVEMHDIPPELLESREDEPVFQIAMSRTKYPERVMEKILYLFEHPEESSHDEVEMLDGRIIDRYSNSMMTDAGQILGRVWFMRDITERKRAAEAVQAALDRHQQQMRVVGAVGKGESLLSGDLDKLRREITEQSAQVMACDRVCIWLFNEAETELHALDIYAASTGSHSSGDILHERDYRDEFVALKHVGYIAADDALAEPRLAGHVENYMKPYGVTSILDAVVEVGGRHLGVLHFGHVGAKRHWEQDEITFARQLADKLGLCILAQMRRVEQEKLRTSQAALAEAEGIARLGSWSYDVLRNVASFSQEAYRILGVDPVRFGHTREAHAALIHPDDRAAFELAYTDSDRRSFAMDYRIVLDDGSIKWIHDIARSFYDADGRRVRTAGTMQDITERKRAEAALQQERDFSTALVDSLPDLFVLIDDKMRLVQWNANLPALIGMPSEQLKGLEACAIVTEEDRELVRAKLYTAFEHGRADLEFNVATKAGYRRRIHFNGQLIESDGRPYLLAIGVDMTEALEAELRLRESEERFRTIFDSVTDAIIVHDLDTGAFIDVNRRVVEMFGYSREEVIEFGLEILMSRSGDEIHDVATPRLRLAAAGEPQVFELNCMAKGGQSFWIEVSLRRAEFSGRHVLLSTAHDITEHKAAHARITQLARYDILTGLANRGVFMEGIEQAIARAERTGKLFGVLYLDLDHFKDVNDTLGHPIGDELLISVAKRLLATTRSRDVVARFGGDEFAVIVTDIHEPTELAIVANNLLTALGESHMLQGNQVRAPSSIGIDIFGPDSSNGETLLAHADLALYSAKSEGRGTYRFFTEDMSVEVRRRVTLGSDLREAISGNQLFLVYQPQVDSQTGQIVGVEALVRWNHPVQGLISPVEFIPVAEKNGLIMALGRWVLNEACRQMKQWLDAGIAPPSVAVNVSGVQFKTPLELEADFNNALTETGLPARYLELEFTETVLMEASRDHNDVLLRLRQRGLRIAIDDFGTGYSSLDYLSRFPVDRIKIAQNFIVDLTSRSSMAIVRAAIGLASELGIDVLVEGAETATQVELVRAWGCRVIQGFYFAKPMPAADIEKLLCVGSMVAEAPSPSLAPHELVPAELNQTSSAV